MNIFDFFKKCPQSRKRNLRVQGKHHHLEEVFKQINGVYFEGRLNLKITWFSRRKTVFQQRIILGSYHFRHRLIRVNDYLDQSHIPEYFVAYIVYHEALHHVYCPISRPGGQRSIHHLQFKEQEKLFKDYDLAMEFRKKIRQDVFSRS